MSPVDKEMSAPAPVQKTEKEVEAGDDEVATEEGRTASEDNVVDWAGEDDAEKPLNWTNKRKVKQILVICYNTFLT